MKSVDSTLTVGFGLNGDFKLGNLELYQFNITSQVGKKVDKNLIRLVFNYEYISENNEVLASDYTAQLRYNYTLGNNSVFTFLQSQKSKALSLNYRHLIGGGYRHNIYKKEDNYFDFSLGAFFARIASFTPLYCVGSFLLLARSFKKLLMPFSPTVF